MNRICYHTALALGTSPSSIKSLPSFGRQVQRDIPIYAKELAQLQAVTPPSSVAATYQKLVRGTAKQLQILRESVAPMLANKLGEARKFTKGVLPSATAVYFADQKLGLLVCSKLT